MQKECETCGKTFSWTKPYTESKAKFLKRRYCSRECAHSVHGSKMKLPLERRLTSALEADIFTRTKQFRRVIRDFYMNKCCICGWNEATCDVCHIISSSDGGRDEIDNVIILCPNHHRMLDDGKISAIEVMEARNNMTLKVVE